MIKKGQSIVEYAIVLSAVAIAMVSVGRYFKVRVEGKWRDSSNEISDMAFEQNSTAETKTVTLGLINTQTGLQVLNESSGE